MDKRGEPVERNQRPELESLDSRLSRAIQTAPQRDKSEQEDNEQAKLVRDFMQGKISLSEFSSSLAKRSDEPGPGELVLKDLDELFHLVQSIWDTELAEEHFEHERQHLELIDEAGWSSQLLFRFFVDEKGIMSGRPSVVPNIPEEGNENKIREKLKQVLQAPEDPSDTDKIVTD